MERGERRGERVDEVGPRLRGCAISASEPIHRPGFSAAHGGRRDDDPPASSRRPAADRSTAMAPASAPRPRGAPDASASTARSRAARPSVAPRRGPKLFTKNRTSPPTAPDKRGDCGPPAPRARRGERHRPDAARLRQAPPGSPHPEQGRPRLPARQAPARCWRDSTALLSVLVEPAFVVIEVALRRHLRTRLRGRLACVPSFRQRLGSRSSGLARPRDSAAKAAQAAASNGLHAARDRLECAAARRRRTAVDHRRTRRQGTDRRPPRL